MAAAIDVVVPTRDRPRSLAACLDALAGQTFRSFRVIVVDDGSGVPVAPAPTGPSETVVVRNERPAGPSATRNRGAAAGDAPFLVFLDDDVRAHPDLLAFHRAAFERHSGPLVSVGRLLAAPDAPLPPWNRWEADRLAREYERVLHGHARASWRHMYTGNVAVRRVDFEAVGGFDERFTRQEDVELGFRLARMGCEFVLDPGTTAWHDAERTLAQWLRLPGAGARHDVLMDRLVPDSGRLAAVDCDLADRHRLLRLASRFTRRPLSRRLAVRTAVAVGRALPVLGLERLGLDAFSLVWHLEYTRALAEARAAPAP